MTVSCYGSLEIFCTVTIIIIIVVEVWVTHCWLILQTLTYSQNTAQHSNNLTYLNEIQSKTCQTQKTLSGKKILLHSLISYHWENPSSSVHFSRIYDCILMASVYFCYFSLYLMLYWFLVICVTIYYRVNCAIMRESKQPDVCVWRWISALTSLCTSSVIRYLLTTSTGPAGQSLQVYFTAVCCKQDI